MFLQPGEVFLGLDAPQADTRVRTLLGSCVAVTFWHPHRLTGAMCHFMLATRGRASASMVPAAFDERAGHYGDEVLALIAGAMRRAGSMPAEYIAKLFGGGSMFGKPTDAASPGSSVSSSNIEAAHRLVGQLGCQVFAQDLGGSYHRSVIFELASGDVWVRRGPALSLDALATSQGWARCR